MPSKKLGQCEDTFETTLIFTSQKFTSTFETIHQADRPKNIHTCGTRLFDGFAGGLALCAYIINDHDRNVLGVFQTFNKPLHAVLLGFLAHDESIYWLSKLSKTLPCYREGN